MRLIQYQYYDELIHITCYLDRKSRILYSSVHDFFRSTYRFCCLLFAFFYYPNRSHDLQQLMTAPNDKFCCVEVWLKSVDPLLELRHPVAVIIIWIFCLRDTELLIGFWVTVTSLPLLMSLQISFVERIWIKAKKLKYSNGKYYIITSIAILLSLFSDELSVHSRMEINQKINLQTDPKTKVMCFSSQHTNYLSVFECNHSTSIGTIRWFSKAYIYSLCFNNKETAFVIRD